MIIILNIQIVLDLFHEMKISLFKLKVFLTTKLFV